MEQNKTKTHRGKSLSHFNNTQHLLQFNSWQFKSTFSPPKITSKSNLLSKYTLLIQFHLLTTFSSSFLNSSGLSIAGNLISASAASNSSIQLLPLQKTKTKKRAREKVPCRNRTRGDKTHCGPVTKSGIKA